jgi:hypothetical protein
MTNYNVIDKSRILLRELQTMLFDQNVDGQLLFTKTLEIDEYLDKASIIYNKYLNDIEKNNIK